MQYYYYYHHYYYFHHFTVFKHSIIDFEYFAVIFGGFLTFWKNLKSKMADPRWRLF